jgi:glycine/D-amino acid oxidase-like deaminating enzyme
MRGIFADFHCDGIEGVLHEKLGGFAVPRKALEGLARKVAEQGVRILTGVEVTGFDLQRGVVRAVETNHGRIRPELVIIGAGPWSGHFWRMLGLPEQINGRPMWTYWQLREGTVCTADPYVANNNAIAPVIHLDHSVPLISQDGRQITPGAWGIYWKMDHSGGVQGGGVPTYLGTSAEIEPYSRARSEVDTEFQDYFRAGLAWAMDRFRKPLQDQQRPNGGIGCFTPDNYPILDFVRSNVYLIADSNHGFKLLGAGKEVAKMLTSGPRRSLQPFRLNRYLTGDLHPSSRSPFPWN